MSTHHAAIHYISSSDDVIGWLSGVQEAVVQYEQYEQEVRHLQGLIEDAHRVIQDRPIPTSNIQELQAQILHHEVLSAQTSPPKHKYSTEQLA